MCFLHPVVSLCLPKRDHNASRECAVSRSDCIWCQCICSLITIVHNVVICSLCLLVSNGAHKRHCTGMRLKRKSWCSSSRLLLRKGAAAWPCRHLHFLMGVLQASMLWDGHSSCPASGFLIVSLLCASPPPRSEPSASRRNATSTPSRSSLARLSFSFFFS